MKELPDGDEAWCGVRARVGLISLALSPFVLLAGLIGFGISQGTMLGSLLGDLLIFGALAVLAFGKDDGISAEGRRTLRWALLVGLLAPAGLALHFMPAVSVHGGGGNSVVRLDPPPHPMPAIGAAVLRGLSVKDGVMILKEDPTLVPNEPSPYSACDNQDWNFPGSHFVDPDGNGMDFKLTGPDLLHFQDDRGGFADVKWDGTQFILVASNSAGQAASAQSPSASAVTTARMGDVLLIVCPMVAWLFITRFAQQERRSRGTGALLVGGMVLQIIAIVGVIFVVTSEPASLDEVSGGLLVLFSGVIVICFGLGVGIAAPSLVRISRG